MKKAATQMVVSLLLVVLLVAMVSPLFGKTQGAGGSLLYKLGIDKTCTETERTLKEYVSTIEQRLDAEETVLALQELQEAKGCFSDPQFDELEKRALEQAEQFLEQSIGKLSRLDNAVLGDEKYFSDEANKHLALNRLVKSFGVQRDADRSSYELAMINLQSVAVGESPIAVKGFPYDQEPAYQSWYQSEVLDKKVQRTSQSLNELRGLVDAYPESTYALAAKFWLRYFCTKDIGIQPERLRFYLQRYTKVPENSFGISAGSTSNQLFIYSYEWEEIEQQCHGIEAKYLTDEQFPREFKETCLKTGRSLSSHKRAIESNLRSDKIKEALEELKEARGCFTQEQLDELQQRAVEEGEKKVQEEFAALPSKLNIVSSKEQSLQYAVDELRSFDNLLTSLRESDLKETLYQEAIIHLLQSIKGAEMGPLIEGDEVALLQSSEYARWSEGVIARYVDLITDAFSNFEEITRDYPDSNEKEAAQAWIGFLCAESDEVELREILINTQMPKDSFGTLKAHDLDMNTLIDHKDHDLVLEVCKNLET